MKFSKYNRLFNVKETYFLYNILTTALIEMDENLKFAVVNNKIEDVDEAYIDDLKKLHFIVNQAQEEEKEYEFFYDSYRYGLGQKRIGLTFIPTFGCNLCCPYCMQGQEKKYNVISDEGIEAIVKFLENKIISSLDSAVPISELYFTLFGGEPLLAKKQLLDFCEKTKSIANKYNCNTVYSMTSNFTLVDDEVIDMIKRYNITTQVSIDGKKEHHDNSRKRFDGTGTYELILKNLKKFKELGLEDNIVIRINITEENLDDAEELMKTFRPYSNDIFFGFVDNFKGMNDHFSSCVSHSEHANIVAKRFADISRKYLGRAFRSFGKKTPCSMNTENRYLIDPELNVYKCELFVKRKEFCVGQISLDGVLDYKPTFYKQMSFSPFKYEKCVKCDLLPLCGGGCPAKAIINNLKEPLCDISEEELFIYLKDYATNIGE